MNGERARWFLDAWRGGRLAAAVVGATRRHEVAARLGVTHDVLDKAWRQARGDHPELPQIQAALLGIPIPPAPPQVAHEPQTPVQVRAEPVQEERVVTLEDRLVERKLRQQVDDLKGQVAELLDALETERGRGELLADAVSARAEVDPIRPRERKSGLREAVAVAMASDWHVEERVDPGTINGVNEFDIHIAKRRIERFFEGYAWLTNYHKQAFQIRDALLCLGGDLLSGIIHPDIVEVAELGIPDTLAFLHQNITAGIRYYLDKTDVECLRLPIVDGNHARVSREQRIATRGNYSLEILLGLGLAREFANEPRVKVDVAGGRFLYVPVYDRLVRLHHGDSFKFGGGVGGIMVPLLRALARWQAVKHADLTLLGHWHQYISLPNVVVNSSLIGYSAYSMSIGAPPEDPTQSFLLLDSKRWKTMDSAIWVTDRARSEAA